jgi:hypothetical protein
VELVTVSQVQAEGTITAKVVVITVLPLAETERERVKHVRYKTDVVLNTLEMLSTLQRERV